MGDAMRYAAAAQPQILFCCDVCAHASRPTELCVFFTLHPAPDGSVFVVPPDLLDDFLLRSLEDSALRDKTKAVLVEAGAARSPCRRQASPACTSECWARARGAHQWTHAMCTAWTLCDEPIVLPPLVLL